MAISAGGGGGGVGGQAVRPGEAGCCTYRRGGEYGGGAIS